MAVSVNMPAGALAPGVNYMLVAPGLHAGQYMPGAMEAALARIETASPAARTDIAKLLGSVRFAPASRRFTAADVDYDFRRSHARSGGMLSWQSPDGVSHARSGVVFPAQVLGSPHSAAHASYFIVPADNAIWMGALEFCRAERAGRPIFAGAADPTPEEIDAHLASEKAGKGTSIGDGIYMNPLANAYFRPKGFERSGKIYERLGVRAFKKAVVTLIGRPMMWIGKKITSAISGPDLPPPDPGIVEMARRARAELDPSDPAFKDLEILDGRGGNFEEFASRAKGGNRYFLGSIRTLKTLREFSIATRRNEGSHALVSIVGLPLVMQMATYLATYPAITIPTLFIYALNVYATMLQRYNRARAENTIDLKLNRGPFKLDLPEIARGTFAGSTTGKSS